MKLLKNELLDWIRLKEEHFTPTEEVMFVGSEEERQAAIEDDHYKEGYNQCLKEMRTLIETLLKEVE